MKIALFDIATLEKAYRNVGLKDGDCVYITGNIGKLGPTNINKEELLQMHVSALQNIIGKKGTIVVPTHSFSLCNTELTFDLEKTKSERGPLTQYILDIAESVRHFHPFSSVTALGYSAKYICENCSRSSYGFHTPFQRMLELDAKYISIGIHPRLTVSLVHQCEQDMAVPYRYNKEFMHPVKRGENIIVEPFYHLVTYRDTDIKRNKNQLFFDEFEKQFCLNVERLGQGEVWGFKMKDFYFSTTHEMRKNIYSWLDTPPVNRPFQK